MRKIITEVRKAHWRDAQIHEEQYWQRIHRQGYKGLPLERFQAWHPLVHAWNVCHTLDCDFDAYQDKVVVEVGCGPLGAIAALQARLGIGVDPLAGRYRTLYGLEQHRCHYLVGCGENLPLSDRCADLVLCINVLDHMRVPAEALREMHRILRPEGKLLLSVNLREEPDACHPHCWNLAELLALLTTCGFEILRGNVVADCRRPEAPTFVSVVCQHCSNSVAEHPASTSFIGRFYQMARSIIRRRLTFVNFSLVPLATPK